MFSLGVFLDVEKNAVDLLQAEVQSLQDGSVICSVQGRKQRLTRTYILTSDPLPSSLAIFQTTSRM